MVSLPSNISARASVRDLFCRVRVQFHVWHISLRTLPGCYEPTKTRAAWLSSLGQALLSGEREMRLLPTPHPGSISLKFHLDARSRTQPDGVVVGTPSRFPW